MKNITKKQKMIFIILAVIIIAGIAVISTIGFNLELKMQETKKIELYIQKDFEISIYLAINNKIIFFIHFSIYKMIFYFSKST